MSDIKELAVFGIVEVVTATALGITIQQYLSSTFKHIIFPLISNFVDLNNFKVGNLFIGKFIRETLFLLITLGVASYILNLYLNYITGIDDDALKEKAKKQILEELGINKRRLMYAMV